MSKRKYLTHDEVSRLLSASRQGVHGIRDECLIKICFIHGFRVSELSSLTLSDVDLSSKVIRINRLKKGFSTIHPLLKNEITLLSQWLKQREHWRGAHSEWLFLSQKGGRLSRQQIYNLLKQYGQKADIPVPLHPHMLRHACGYALADNGTDTRLIQDYLGHRNIRHTVLYTASNAARFRGVWQRD
ncbi:tyrosine-type DNA invertase [Serratia sp. OS31]|uniref:tyrosine-type DNA invertase n=1 Tax=Serratia sp. OS31 TaxID=2760844 RepID=UPI001603485E|nr:tyrosine-type DNA invertase [Serratia sp. OS31]MBB1585010.1 tyrosine-type recombinase/integrase [Serratia sp. OS31]